MRRIENLTKFLQVEVLSFLTVFSLPVGGD